MTHVLGILSLACGMQLICIVRDGIRPLLRAWRGRVPRPTGIIYVPKHATDIPGF